MYFQFFDVSVNVYSCVLHYCMDGSAPIFSLSPFLLSWSSVTAQKRGCNTATCVTHRLADFLSRSGGMGNSNFVPTNVGAKAFGRRRRSIQMWAFPSGKWWITPFQSWLFFIDFLWFQESQTYNIFFLISQIDKNFWLSNLHADANSQLKFTSFFFFLSRSFLSFRGWEPDEKTSEITWEDKSRKTKLTRKLTLNWPFIHSFTFLQEQGKKKDPTGHLLIFILLVKPFAFGK